MKPQRRIIPLRIAAPLIVGAALWFAGPAPMLARAAEVPVKGMITMVDLGARKCIPCKMMAPILVKLEKEFAGKAAIVFVDVWENPAPARRFGIRAIPTQIFFDDQGREVLRHVGFMSEAAIVEQLSRMGVTR